MARAVDSSCRMPCTMDRNRTGLRVGFLIDRWDPRRGGAERVLATFAAWLEARGHEVLAFALEGPRPGDTAPGTFIPVRTHGWTRSSREFRLARALSESAREMNCDVTVGVRHLSRVDLLWPHGGSHAATLRALGKRALGRHRAFLKLENQAVADGGARRVICVSELVRQEMLDFYPSSAGRLALVPNGLDESRFEGVDRESARRELLAASGGPGRQPIVTFVGRNPQLKGLPLLFKALARLRERPWRMVVAGPSDAERWRRRGVKVLGEGARLHVAADMDPLTLAAGSDLLVLPSKRESCGLVVLEALAAGTPVLVSSAVGAKEVLTDAQQGAVFSNKIKAGELAQLISEQLDRIELGMVDRAIVRRAVAGRGLAEWMGAMEEQVLDLAGSTS